MYMWAADRRYPLKSDEAAGRLAARKPSTWTVDWTVEVWVDPGFLSDDRAGSPKDGAAVNGGPPAY